MVYRSTEEMVERVRPLLERLAIRTIDKARLLQYLSARAGVDWGSSPWCVTRRFPTHRSPQPTAG